MFLKSLLIFFCKSFQKKVIIQMSEIRWDKHYLRDSCFKLLIFYSHLIHNCNKALFSNMAITTIKFFKFLTYLFVLSFIFFNYWFNMIDIFFIYLLIYSFGFSYEFFHFFHEIFSWEGFMASELIFFKEIDYNYFNVCLI